jgi:diaminopimelate epimerase
MLRAMRIEFVKMQGLGNDFFVFDAPRGASGGELGAATLRALADRHTGVGFDQALMLEAPRDAGSIAYYRIFNADGSEVEQCGNGARCVAALLHTRAPQRGREFTLGSPGGTIRARVREDSLVSVEIGTPDFAPQSLPMNAAQADRYRLQVAGSDVSFGAVCVGNPHVVIDVANVSTAPVATIGPALGSHALFPRHVNVGFMQVLDRQRIRLRVFERGVGETRACGTGACAAVAVGRRRGDLDADVQVELPGGTARVSWEGPGQSLWLTGPASIVFTGSVEVQ